MPIHSIQFRFWLWVLACGWAVVGVCNWFILPTHRWAPELVAVLAVATAICGFVFAYRPETVWAYRLEGTLAIGTLFLRSASIVLGEVFGDDSDALWISASTVITTAMFALIYWYWWLGDVKRWHEIRKHTSNGVR